MQANSRVPRTVLSNGLAQLVLVDFISEGQLYILPAAVYRGLHVSQA